MQERKEWTKEQDGLLMEKARASKTLSMAFMAVAEQTGHPKKSVANHYYRIRAARIASRPTGDVTAPVHEETETETKKGKPWTKEEDDCLLRYVKAGVSNLKYCFMAVAEQTGRTPTAVAAHWYCTLSKRPDIRAFFRASENEVLWNRKNGKGVPSTASIWHRILGIVKSIGR